MSSTQPVIFLAFAYDPAHPLKFLDQEYKAVYDGSLKEKHRKRVIDVWDEKEATPHIIADVFEDRKGDIKIFHYAGHADSATLQLKGDDVRAEGLKTYMEGVELVVLNGCATRGQVSDFMEVESVKAVIASRVKIDDELAYKFADRFYQKLIKDQDTLYDAFASAVNFIGLTDPQRRAVSFVRESQNYQDKEVAWELWVKTAAAKSWSLEDILVQEGIDGLPKDNKAKLVERFLKLDAFSRQEEELVNLLYGSPSGLHAFACIVHGKGPNEQYGQHWISGNLFANLLKKRVQTANVQSIWNLSLEKIHSPELFFKYLYDRMQGRYDFDMSKEDSKYLTLGNIGYDLLGNLQHSPIVIKVKDDIRIYELEEQFLSFTDAWIDICNAIDEQIPNRFPDAATNPPALKPLIFILVQEEGTFAPQTELEFAQSHIEAIEEGLFYCLQENQDIHKQNFLEWIENEIKQFTEPMLQQIIRDKHQDTIDKWFESNSLPPIQLMKSISKEFDLQLEFSNDHWKLTKKQEDNSSFVPRRRRRRARARVRDFSQ
ncbi:MAG: CHAT domain-containing protein [Bacteroidota bacterium]